MGERKGVNKYYPPDYDPSKGSLNKWIGQHPLRDRARKIHKGILVIRFEMPYNIWCNGCNNHIGMGVRYNAEKSKVGNYYTTPIYKFRMKCHLCDNYFEIQTDPKNHDYVILEGARRKEQRWDPKENEQIVPEDKGTQKKLATDPMYKLEHGSDDQYRGKSSVPSIAQIEDMRDAWQDDYILNRLARNKFRRRSRSLPNQAVDKALLKKSSLDIELVPETEQDRRLASLIKYSVTKSFDEKQQETRKAIASRPLFKGTNKPLSSACGLSGEELNKRTEIKQKLGLHLTSPRVEQSLKDKQFKVLVRSVHKTSKKQSITI
ncbi:coiled-coil domain-containing protein 130 homolog [Pomacea canaliculata]|uniref:coiled-coil domain-containing protein 130 homolog n=1 Tax=Pomacea canaliculata TaxID=400727 RepID=UPI000D730A7C|nr:coiled-coil domain-containing protein 130 homolog [Pomacea canaliculata]